MNFRKEHYIEPWKVFVLTFITLGLYQFYWAFHTWKFIKEQTNTKINPWWRTLAIFIALGPITVLFYNILLITTKLKKKKTLLIAFLLAALDVIFDYNYGHITVNTKILILVLTSIYTSGMFAIIQHKINKYVIEGAGNIESPNIKDISDFNPRIFQIITFICAIIEICLISIMKLEEPTLTVITFLLIGITIYITIKIYEMKAKKYGQ